MEPQNLEEVKITKKEEQKQHKPEELNLMISSTVLGSEKASDVLEIMLPKHWPDDGVLNIGVLNDSIQWLDAPDSIVAITKEEIPNAPLLTLHLISRRSPYSLSAEKLDVGGKGNYIAPDTDTNENDTLQRMKIAWLKLKDDAKTIHGDLTVPRNYELKPGVYLVEGDTKIKGKIAGNITILCAGRIQIASNDIHMKPYADGILMLAQKGIVLNSQRAYYEGTIASFSDKIEINGALQTFLNGGLYAPTIKIKGVQNAFLTLFSQETETE